MRSLIWEEGAKDLGCVYHKKAIVRRLNESRQVDVFVQRGSSRGIAITINRYVNGVEIAKRQLGIPDPLQDGLVIQGVSTAFNELGWDPEASAYAAGEVADLLKRDEPLIRTALKEIEG
jgi:hypothetical protein